MIVIAEGCTQIYQVPTTCIGRRPFRGGCLINCLFKIGDDTAVDSANGSELNMNDLFSCAWIVANGWLASEFDRPGKITMEKDSFYQQMTILPRLYTLKKQYIVHFRRLDQVMRPTIHGSAGP